MQIRYLRNVKCEAIFSCIESSTYISMHGLLNGKLDIAHILQYPGELYICYIA